MEDLKKEKSSLHIAVIPDGNRRWAKEKGLKPWQGHEKGAEVIEALSIKALEIGIKSISFWGSSQDNLQKRPLQEKKALLKIYERYFKRLVNDKRIYENKAKINIIGRWQEQFPFGLKKILKEGIKKTKNHSKHFLNFLLAYSGDDDVLESVERITQKIKINPKIKITKNLIKENLLSRDLMPVDLIIRTGTREDPHNSAGFLMWQTQNSQFYFSDKYLPDFTTDDFVKAIKDYCERERRIGK